MDICMVTEDFLSFGGGPKHVERLSEVLVEKGHDVTVLAPRKENGREPGVKTLSFRGFRAFGDTIKSKIVPKFFLEAGKHDLVHAHSYLFPALLTSHVENFFITTHGLRCSLNNEHGLFGYIFHKAVTENNLRAANEKGCIFCVSKLDHEMCNKLGFENSYYVPNGIDFKRISNVDGTEFREKHRIENRIVLEVARFNELKGQLRFVKDCAEQVQNKVDVTFVFAGAKGEEKYMKRLKEEINRRNLSVKILTNISDEEIYQAHKAADLFILPTEYEGQPIGIWEAFAGSTPAVATDVGGVKESTAQYASIVPFWDPRQFTREIISLLGDDEERGRLGREAFEYVKQYSWEEVGSFVEEKYNQVLENMKPGK